MLETLGRYKILSTIGQGAMGVVYKAVDPMIDRTVAIKTVNLTLSSDELEEYEARFQQEIKAAGRLNHPNIVTVYDVGRTDTFAYMAMEFLEGKELKDILVNDGRPPIASTVDWIGQIALGLHFAHDHDIIHRDVKPSNIMIVRGGYAKITDFGIARMPGAAVKTMTGMILGSPRYMSPEQVIGKSLDSRTDIFSLGVVLYETLTGKPPFDGDNINAIMYATCNAVPPAPSAANAEIPTMLDLIVAKALAKTVDERYQNMSDFAQDLAEVKRVMLRDDKGNSVIAKQAPPSGKQVNLEMGRYQKSEEDVEVSKPLKLAKGFDSFDATVRLAAMTKQTDEFSQYISDTKKMRAYQGTIGAPPANDDTRTLTMDQMAEIESGKPVIARTRGNLLIVGAIVVLAGLAVGLLVTLLMG
ncbi:MAG: serine/threonine protein kinase [Betaproteobacteria bacterium]|nr:serine/threonine protein kinase [Betaproteobacteria bacterium]